MDSITVAKSELLEAIKKNREGHRNEFIKAQEGWRATIIEELDRRLKDARNGRRVQATFSMPEPVDHTGDYDRVIRMIEMHQEQTVSIPEHDFAMYVMDDWDWKVQWSSSNTAYINRVRSV